MYFQIYAIIIYILFKKLENFSKQVLAKLLKPKNSIFIRSINSEIQQLILKYFRYTCVY